ncbi:MAG: hypothetical protein SVP26_08960, partial [Chloroflexota bacterium]|nr:hypothetical protein [Chloroflexota bacterium]
MGQVKELVRTARRVRATEGPVPLLRRALAFAVGLVFLYRVYNLYVLTLEDTDGLGDEGPAPPMEGVSYVVLSTNQQVDDLEADGYEFRALVRDARARLDAGAVATCVFVGKELANVCWVATTQEAADSLNEPPFHIEYGNRECCSGDGWTNPRYRRAGLLAYGDVKRRQYQYQQGIRVSKWAVEKSNVPTNKVASRIGARVPIQGRLLRILGWKWWKEEAVSFQPASPCTEPLQK